MPEEIRHLAGKTFWWHSRKTTGARKTAVQRARYTACYDSQVIRLRATLASDVEAHVAMIFARTQSDVDGAFDRLSAPFGSMDRAMATEIDSVAIAARSLWSLEEAR